MARSVALVCVFIAGTLVGTDRAHAQNVPLSQLLVNLIQSEIRLEPPPPGFVSHEAHFLPGVDQSLAPYLFNQQLVAQLATFPTGAPTGGFSFTFDPETGAFRRETNSFGPYFADRALTNGRGKMSFGVNFQYSKYNSFEGADLENGDVKFYLTHQDLPGSLFFEGDLVEASLRLNLTSTTTTIHTNYGVTNALDIAVSVPILHVNMEATTDARVLRLATTGQGTSTIHSFPGGTDRASFSDSGTATGIGDILVRAKYRFLSSGGGGLAAGVDVRLPTGDADELLGTGAAAATVSLIGSSSAGALAPHFNVSFTGSGESDVVSIANEFGYKVGTEIVASPSVTFTADLLGRTLIDAGRLELASTTHSYFTVNNVPGSITLDEYVARSASLNIANLAVGGKFNVAGNLLINANVLFSLTSSGVTARFTPVFGIDYTF